MVRGLERRDFLAVVVLAVVDLALTFYGIVFRRGAELSPFFRLFTETPELVVAGALLYLGILKGCDSVLGGRLRAVLASVAAGMHLVGITTWVTMFIYPPAAFRWENVYYYEMWLALATAGSYAVFERQGWRYGEGSLSFDL
jgi:hypothetical protein